MFAEQGRTIIEDAMENEPKRKKVRGATRLDYASVAKARVMASSLMKEVSHMVPV